MGYKYSKATTEQTETDNTTFINGDKYYPGDRLYIGGYEFEVTHKDRLYCVESFMPLCEMNDKIRAKTMTPDEWTQHKIRDTVFAIDGYRLMEFFNNTGLDMQSARPKDPAKDIKNINIDRLIEQFRIEVPE